MKTEELIEQSEYNHDPKGITMELASRLRIAVEGLKKIAEAGSSKYSGETERYYGELANAILEKIEGREEK